MRQANDCGTVPDTSRGSPAARTGDSRCRAVAVHARVRGGGIRRSARLVWHAPSITLSLSSAPCACRDAYAWEGFRCSTQHGHAQFA
ncbi:hypothetical protein SGLAM104S_08117 [Streptomyces glaucescens]